MILRLIFHISLLSALVALGIWVIYQDLLPAQQGGFSTLDGLAAAMYWFALLIYGLFSSLAYVVLRRRSFQSLMIAHLFSAGIGMLCAVGIVILGQKHVDEVMLNDASTGTNDPQPHTTTDQVNEGALQSSPLAPPVISE